MSPQYEYQCEAAHVETRLRKYEDREEGLECRLCGQPMSRIWSAHHQAPDGIHSYAPNIGDANTFERRQAKIERNKERAKDGKRYQIESE